MVDPSKPKREWTIREYREGDEEQILELRGIALSGHRNKQWWQWQYRDNPAGPAAVMVAEVNKEIIAHHASTFVKIKIKDQVTQGSHGVDLMVHPDYRRQGIFIALSKALNESLKGVYRSISFGTPNDQSRPGFVKKLNAMEIGQVSLLMKVIEWGNVLKSRYKIPALIGKLIGIIWEGIIYRIPLPNNSGITVEEISSFDERIDRFWEKASKLKNIMVVKNMRYLNWRYVAKPGKEYRIFIAQKQSEIVGFIVLKLEKNAHPRGFIMDLLTLPGEATVPVALIIEAIRYFKEAKTAMISCWMLPDTPYFKTLKRLGFVRRPGPILCSRVIDPNIPKDLITNLANWYYVMGDDDT